MSSVLNSSLIYGSAANPFFEEDFIQVLESHQEYLKRTGNWYYETVDQRYMGTYIGDFYAILQTLQLSPKYHRIIMRLNGFTNPIQYDGQLLKIFIPDTVVIDNIYSVYRSGNGRLPLGTPGE